MSISVRYDFSLLVEALNLKSEYEIMLEDNKISVPKNRRHLDSPTAEWCVENIHVLNKKTKSLKKLIDLCTNYLILIEKSNNVVFVVE